MASDDCDKKEELVRDLAAKNPNVDEDDLGRVLAVLETLRELGIPRASYSLVSPYQQRGLAAHRTRGRN